MPFANRLRPVFFFGSALGLVVAGCTSLLGDFTADTGGGSPQDDGGADASEGDAGSDGGTSPGTDAADGGNATSDAKPDAPPHEGGPDGSGACDAGGPLLCDGGCATGYSSCTSACVDLQKDTANCGRCGHGCLYGGCSAGKCTAWSMGGGTFYRGDGNYLLTQGLSGFSELKSDGKSSVAVSPDLFPQTGPGLANGTAVWLAPGPVVYSAPEGTAKGTAGPSFTVPANQQILGFATNPSATTGFVLWQNNTSPYPYYVTQCPLSGTGCGTLGTLESSTSSIGYHIADFTMTSTNAFWILSDSPTFAVRSLTLATNKIESVTPNGYPSHLTVDANNIYFVANPLYTIYKLPSGFVTNATPVQVTTAGSSITSVTSDGTNVYFGTYQPNGLAQVFWAPVSGGNATPLFASKVTVASPSTQEFVTAGGGVIYIVDEDISNSIDTIYGIAPP